jgi:hypothetical protein
MSSVRTRHAITGGIVDSTERWDYKEQRALETDRP